jgi:hypothetical protein
MLRAKEEELHKVQHLLSKNGKESREIEYREELVREGRMADLARWDSLSTAEAKAWLQLLPTRISFRMNNAQLISALRLRLNVPLERLTEGIVCNVCPGRQVMDSAHITNCKDKNGIDIKTHDGLIREVKGLVRFAGKAPSTTFPSPFLEKMSNESEAIRAIKGDIMILTAGKRALMLDGRITSPVTAEVKRGKQVEPLAAARAGEKLKDNKFMDKCQSIQIGFMPLLVETYGAWGQRFQQFFNNMISAAAEFNKIDTSYVKNYWMKRISMAIQKGIANAVNTRIYSLRAGGEALRDESNNLSYMT